MAKFYNPKRTPVNLVLADGSAILIGGHQTVIVAEMSASLRRAETKGLIKRLHEPAAKAPVGEQKVEVSEVLDQALVVPSVQSLPEPANEELDVDISTESSSTVESMEDSGLTIDEETPSEDSEETHPGRSVYSRRKKRSR